MNYQFDFGVVFQRWPELLQGCLLTLELSLLAMPVTLGIAIIAVYLLLQKNNRIARHVIETFVEIVRNTPFLVQIFFLFFGLPSAGIRLNPQLAAILALSLNGAAYAIEILRGGVEAVPHGQIEAGQALALSPAQIFRHVILKPALGIAFPALKNQFIFLMLTSSIASSITARELTHVGAELEAETFRSFEVYFTIAGLYLVMSYALSKLLTLLGRVSLSYPVR